MSAPLGPAALAPEVARELLNVLLRLARADGGVCAQEQALWEELADAWLPDDDDLAAVHGWIEGRVELPMPRLAPLREVPAEILRECVRMARVNGAVSEEEEAFVFRLRGLLAG